MMTLIIRTGWDLAVASIGTAVGNTMYKLGNILWDCRDSIKEEINYRKEHKDEEAEQWIYHGRSRKSL